MLGAVPGVSSANVRRVSGDSVTFDLTVRGGGARDRAHALELAKLHSRGPTHRRGASVAPLVYRYRPG